jgi:uncharacterized peroxidase-related enzyme
MSRLPILAVADAPADSQPLLEAVRKQLGTVPNMMKLLATAPAALEGYLALSGALGKGALDAKLRESVALVVSEHNGCDYCLAAHTFVGKNFAKLSDEATAKARDGLGLDERTTAALIFARSVARERGRVQEAEITALREAGFTDAQVLEIVVNVALTVLTNYVNNVAQTELDFPRVSRHTH